MIYICRLNSVSYKPCRHVMRRGLNVAVSEASRIRAYRRINKAFHAKADICPEPFCHRPDDIKNHLAAGRRTRNDVIIGIGRPLSVMVYHKVYSTLIALVKSAELGWRRAVDRHDELGLKIRGN